MLTSSKICVAVAKYERAFKKAKIFIKWLQSLTNKIKAGTFLELGFPFWFEKQL